METACVGKILENTVTLARWGLEIRVTRAAYIYLFLPLS